MDIWRYTIKDLTGGRPAIPYPDLLDFPEQNFDSETIQPVPSDNQFATAAIAGSSDLKDQLLLKSTETGWKMVGGFIGETLFVNKCARGRGLSVELLLRCLKHRTFSGPISKEFSDAGLRVLKKAHKKQVQSALADNLAVPSEVLNEYPDLIGK